MLVPIVLRKSFAFNLEGIGLDIDCFDCGEMLKSDFKQFLLMVRKIYTITIEMVGTDDDNNLFYDYDSFRPSIDREQEFFQDLAKIESKYLRTSVYGIFREWLKENAQLNGKTFHEWEMVVS